VPLGKSSLREMNTIMPAMRPNATPNTPGLKTSFRIAQPSRAPAGENSFHSLMKKVCTWKLHIIKCLMIVQSAW